MQMTLQYLHPCMVQGPHQLSNEFDEVIGLHSCTCKVCCEQGVRTKSSTACVMCRPYGVVRLNIKATWIQDASPQQDALTDLSFMSSLGQQSMNSSGIGTDTVEQVGSTLTVYLRAQHFHWHSNLRSSSLTCCSMTRLV